MSAAYVLYSGSKVMPAGPDLEGAPASVVTEGMMKAILEVCPILLDLYTDHFS